MTDPLAEAARTKQEATSPLFGPAGAGYFLRFGDFSPLSDD